MLINEVSKITNLTKKAIEYYTEHGLVSPDILENGYRDYSEDDVIHLNKISVLRKLGLSTEEIASVFADETGNVLQKLSVQKELQVQREQVKKSILHQLSSGNGYAEISKELKTLEQGATIADKLLEAFPGYYGRFICLHFSSFLKEPIETQEQRFAYQEIISFLDNVPTLTFPSTLQEFIDENTKHIGAKAIGEMLEGMKHSFENPDQFLAENREIIEDYLAYRQSEEYKNSPTFLLQEMLRTFNETSGYYDIFIPAMKKLSSSYSAYYQQMERANKRLLSVYPEIERL